MSSPNYSSDQGNGLQHDQKYNHHHYNSTAATMNGNNGLMMDHSSSGNNTVLIGAMKSYVDDDSDNNNIKQSNNIQVSSLPTSSTTSTISTSATNAASINSFNTASSQNNSSVVGNGAGGDDVCRDFLRNACRRGKSCRFKHPDTGEADNMMGPNSGGNHEGGGGRGNHRRSKGDDNMVFCHDYQNRECRRENCRFLHCSKAEEEVFRNTGKLPSHMTGQQAAEAIAMVRDNTPVCKDFVNGNCRRAPGRCKFRHPDNLPQQQQEPQQQQYHQQAPLPNANARNSFDGRNGGGQRGGGSNNNYAMCSTNSSPHNLDPYTAAAYGRGNMAMASSYSYDQQPQYAENPNKRKRYDSMYASPPNAYAYPQDPMQGQVHGGYPAAAGYAASSYYGAPRNQMDSRSYLEEENTALRRRIDDLKKQITELVNSNDYLMDQVNQMRLAQNVAAVGPSAAAVAVATATSVASLQPPQSSIATSMGTTMSAGHFTQSLSLAPVSMVGPSHPPPPPPPPGTTVLTTPVALVPHSLPSSIVSSIASISMPTVATTLTTPVSQLVNSSAAASLVSFTPSLVHATQNAWPLGVGEHQ